MADCSTPLRTSARGTGRSSIVKGLLNRYAKQGLRLIEVEKNDLVDLPTIVDQVARFTQSDGTVGYGLHEHAFIGPFRRCYDHYIPEWHSIIDVPDITFRVTQDVNGDGTQVTFKLRPGVKYANIAPLNGREFTSADV